MQNKDIYVQFQSLGIQIKGVWTSVESLAVLVIVN